MADTLAWCACGCPFAAHTQHVANTKLDFCEDHGLHVMYEQTSMFLDHHYREEA